MNLFKNFERRTICPERFEKCRKRRCFFYPCGKKKLTRTEHLRQITVPAPHARKEWLKANAGRGGKT